MADYLTSNLSHELEKTNLAFNRWAEQQQHKLSSNQANFQKREEELRYNLQALIENDVQLDMINKENNEIKLKYDAELLKHQGMVDKLKSQIKLLETQFLKLTTEETLLSSQLSQTATEYTKLHETTLKSDNDVTMGVALYRKLGLEFQKCPNNAMKFTFTQIDARNPKREFYFSIYVDDQDVYQFVESSPEIEASKIIQMMEQINIDCDISVFVFKMRKAFISLA